MVKKLRINESLKSNEIGTHPRIGVTDGRVYVNYYTKDGNELLDKKVLYVKNEYVNINGILMELNSSDRSIPKDIVQYEINSFNPLANSSLALIYEDDYNNRLILLNMSLYEAACFLLEEDFAKFNIQ